MSKKHSKIEQVDGSNDKESDMESLRDTVNYKLTKEKVGSIIDANTLESTKVNMATKILPSHSGPAT